MWGSQKEEIKPHRGAYYLEKRDAEFELKMAAFCVSIVQSRFERSVFSGI